LEELVPSVEVDQRMKMKTKVVVHVEVEPTVEL
jgi:hypothetical protein